MAQDVFGKTISFTSGSGAQQVLGGQDGIFDVTIRTESEEVYLGGADVTGGATGFLLRSGRDYHFVMVAAADHEPYLATTSASAVAVFVFSTPKL
jgi:hypothetical protein